MLRSSQLVGFILGIVVEQFFVVLERQFLIIWIVFWLLVFVQRQFVERFQRFLQRRLFQQRSAKLRAGLRNGRSLRRGQAERLHANCFHLPGRREAHAECGAVDLQPSGRLLPLRQFQFVGKFVVLEQRFVLVEQFFQQ